MPSNYDIGAITREAQDHFRLFSRDSRGAAVDASKGNLATPENLRTFLDGLTRVTDAVVARRGKLWNFVPDAAIAAWDARMTAWRGRLNAYRVAVVKAPAGDRADVLWTVTAPLLLGFFGGPNSEAPQQPIDAVTPYMLANQLAVDEAWRDETHAQLWVDVVEPVTSAAGIGTVVLVAAVGGLVLLRRRGRR